MAYTAAQNKATQKYKKANLEEIRVSVRKGDRAKLKEVAQAANMSMAEYVCTAVNSYCGMEIISSKIDGQEKKEE